MPIKVDLQRTSELDEDIGYPPSGWFDVVPRRGEMIHFRDASNNIFSPRMVIGVNHMETDPNTFHVLVVVE